MTASIQLIRFPAGLAGFEAETEFRLVIRGESAPAVLLESVATPGLFFVTIPVTSVEPAYELKLLDEYRHLLGERATAGPLLTLAIVCVVEGQPPSVNLAAPVVIAIEASIGVQAIRDDARYSTAHALILTADQSRPQIEDPRCS